MRWRWIVHLPPPCWLFAYLPQMPWTYKEDIGSLCDVAYETDGGRVRQELFYGAKQLKKFF
jgi:hypothetical protein